MSLQLVANHLAQKGRGPDSNLVHMSNREVAGLQALAKRHGGSLSVNPDTGLPEAGFLDSILPTIAGAGLTYFSGGAITPMMAAGIVGGISALDSKDLSKGLMAGLGAYGGAGLTAGLMTAGTGALTQQGIEAAGGAEALGAVPGGATGIAENVAGASNFDRLSAGVGDLFSPNAGRAMQAIGGGSQLAGAGMFGAVAAPMLADEMVETTTEAPEQSRGMIRPYTYSRQQAYPTQDYQGNIGSKERRYFNEGYTAGDPYAAANGGLVALAGGGDMRRRRGYEQQSLFTPTTPLPANNMYGASRDAYDYLMGVNTPSGGQPYDPNRPFPPGMRPEIPENGMQPNPNTPKTGTGKYEFDPVTKQYKWVPDPIKPVDATLPVFENPAERGGGGGNRGGGDEGTPGEGFNPTSEGAYNVSRFGQAISPVSPFLGGIAGAYGDYLAKNVDPNYSHEAMNTSASKDLNLPTISADDDNSDILGLNGETSAADPFGNFYDSPLSSRTDISGYPLRESELKSFERGLAPAAPQTNTVDYSTGLYNDLSNRPDSSFPAGTNYTDKAFTRDVFGNVLSPDAPYTSGATTSANMALVRQNAIAGSDMQRALDSQTTPTDAENSARIDAMIAGLPDAQQVRPSDMGALPFFGRALASDQDTPDTNTYGGGYSGTRTALNPFPGIANYGSEARDTKNVGTYIPGQFQGAYLPGDAEGVSVAPAPAPEAAPAPAPAPVAAPPAPAPVAPAPVQMVNVTETYQGDDPNPPGDWTRTRIGRDDYRLTRTVSVPASSVVGGGGGGGGGGDGLGNPGSSFGFVQAPGERGRGGGGAERGDPNAGRSDSDRDRGDARGGYLQHGQFDQRMAHGGITSLPNPFNLGSYSDGGRLLKGPGDGVSDSIPATIGRGQPARLADGEFVIPARIVSELGNGSTDAGARELYKMMDRIQAGRRKTVGKDQVAKNSKSVRHLPA